MLESVFQRQVIEELEEMLPGCIVLVKPGYYIQGFPDLLVLYGPMWVTLEVKRDEDAPYQPNQEYYLDQLNDMHYAATIYPQNMEEVLREVQQTFRRSSRQSRRSRG